MLSNSDLVELIAFRHALHRQPELSGQEHKTARRVVAFLEPTQPDKMLCDLGGTGVAAIYEGRAPGPTVMIRAELDGLPIEELGAPEYRSEVTGKGHLCGHDGHMVMVAALGRLLARSRPERGRVILMFQPAEETGQGAAAVLQDPRWAQIAPDYAFALHNLPGMPLGQVAVAEGAANCASRGMQIDLVGRTAHASMPETGVSPANAVARLLPALTALGQGGALVPGFRLVTLTHVNMGEPAFGIAPGQARILATLRCLEDGDMASLVAEAEAVVQDVAYDQGLGVSLGYHDVFHACSNAPLAVDYLKQGAARVGMKTPVTASPKRWSEDFGLYGSKGGAQSAMFLLGAGEDHAQLHNPDYDFPDDILSAGIHMFWGTIEAVLDKKGKNTDAY